jgi:DOPA 4,5-dioxygenase
MRRMNDDRLAPWHAHVYYGSADELARARALHERLGALLQAGALDGLLYVGPMRDRPVGPHPQPQFETHFHRHAMQRMRAVLQDTGLRALLHPLTQDDLADHTTLAHWIGEPLALDLAPLDPPGHNQGLPRFGRTDF